MAEEGTDKDLEESELTEWDGDLYLITMILLAISLGIKISRLI